MPVPGLDDLVAHAALCRVTHKSLRWPPAPGDVVLAVTSLLERLCAANGLTTIQIPGVLEAEGACHLGRCWKRASLQ